VFRPRHGGMSADVCGEALEWRCEIHREAFRQWTNVAARKEKA
jgi:hypothetical protein